jgi:hypothetical protein
VRGIALATFVLVALAFSFSVHADEGDTEEYLAAKKTLMAKKMSEPVELTGVDLSIPTQPAAHLLGVDPTAVQRVSNVRELLLAAINSTDQQGNLQQGFAFAITHWRLTRFRGTAEKLLRGQMARDVEYSIAAVKGSTADDPSAKLGIGLSWPYTDNTRPFKDINDVRTYFEAVEAATSAEIAALHNDADTISGALAEPAEPYSGPPRTLDDAFEALAAITDDVEYSKDFPSEDGELSPADISLIELEVAALWDRFGELWIAERERQLKKRQEDRWNAHALSFAGGLAWVSPSGLSADFRSDRYGVWVRGAVPHGNRGQVLYALSYRDRETVPDPSNEGEFTRRNVWFVGGRYVLGGATHGVSGEISYRIENPEEGDSERVWTYLLGHERRLTKDQWLQMSIGREGDRSTGDRTLFGLSYNIGLGNKAQIAR